jgi:hypothetical protein
MGIMSQAALIAELEAMLNNDPNYDPVAAIVAGEKMNGFRVLRPGNTPWFLAADWMAYSVVSVSGTLVRFVLIEAHEPGTGAFTRTVKGLQDAGYKPAVIDPTREFAAMLKRRGWRGKAMGHNFETTETVWRPA